MSWKTDLVLRVGHLSSLRSSASSTRKLTSGTGARYWGDRRACRSRSGSTPSRGWPYERSSGPGRKKRLPPRPRLVHIGRPASPSRGMRR